MKYLIEWMFNGKKRWWGGFGVGFTTVKENARIFTAHDMASREADKVLNWCWFRFGPRVDYGASVRPAT